MPLRQGQHVYNPLRAKPPVAYNPAPGTGFLTSKIKEKEVRPKDMLDWVRVTKGSTYHLKKTVCCRQGCRIGDIIVIVPVWTARQELGPAVPVHVGCLREFLENVPDEMNVIKEHVQEIKAKFEE